MATMPLGDSTRITAFPPASQPPDGESGEVAAFQDERPSVSNLRAAAATVALRTSDVELRSRLGAAVQQAGLEAVGEDGIEDAVVVVADALRGSEQAVGELRRRTRADAAIVVLLSEGAPASEFAAARQAGAVACMRKPFEEHQLLGVIESAVDLHGARAHADDLARKLDLQTHLASVGRVTANFSHELSNPLSTLAANYQVVRECFEAQSRGQPAPRVDVGAALDDMASALQRIEGILATVRALARGSRTTGIEEVDLVRMVRDVRRWTAAELEGIDVQELVDAPVVAIADPRLLGQILVNLVTNAAHAARQLPSPKMRLHVYDTAEGPIVSVRDNGPGIPPELRDHIFEPFFTTRREQGGTGLGLALCREYATQMQARLSLWTAPGRGTCFRVHLRRR